MYKALNQVINDFMGSFVYGEMVEEFKSEEFEEFQGEFFNTMIKITPEAEKEIIENIVMDYLGSVEKLGVMIGFKFASDLSKELNRFGGGYDV